MLHTYNLCLLSCWLSENLIALFLFFSSSLELQVRFFELVNNPVAEEKRSFLFFKRSGSDWFVDCCLAVFIGIPNRCARTSCISWLSGPFVELDVWFESANLCALCCFFSESEVTEAMLNLSALFVRFSSSVKNSCPSFFSSQLVFLLFFFFL